MQYFKRIITVLAASLLLLTTQLTQARAEQTAQQQQVQEQPVFVYSPKGDLDIYQAPGADSGVKKVLAQGLDAVLLETRGEWSMVLFWNEAGEPGPGYVKADKVVQRQAEESTNMAVLTSTEGQRVALYKGRNAKGTVLYRYAPGVRVQVLSLDEKGWAKVGIQAVEGYVRQDSLDWNLQQYQPADLPEVRVQYAKAHSLSMREAASYKAKQLGGVPNGEVVRVLGVGGEFAHVMTGDGRVGFIMAAGLYPQPLLAEVTQTAPVAKPEGMETIIDNPDGQGANLRARASSAGDMLGLYPNGTAVVVTGGSSWWKKVWVDGKTGYMMAKLLRDFVPKEGEATAQGNEDDTQAAWGAGEDAQGGSAANQGSTTSTQGSNTAGQGGTATAPGGGTISQGSTSQGATTTNQGNTNAQGSTATNQGDGTIVPPAGTNLKKDGTYDWSNDTHYTWGD